LAIGLTFAWIFAAIGVRGLFMLLDLA